MKKTIGLIAMLIIALVMLTGCVNINYELKVNSDGSGDISYLYTFSKESLSSLGVTAQDMIGNSKQKAEESDYKTELYEDDNVSGFKASKHLKNLSEDFSLQEAFDSQYVTDSNKNEFTFEKNMFETTISQNSEINLESMKDIASAVTMKYTVKLPSKVKESNATEVSKDGKVLTWDLKGGETNKVEFTTTTINILPIIIICVVVVLLIAGIVLEIIFYKKKKATK